MNNINWQDAEKKKPKILAPCIVWANSNHYDSYYDGYNFRHAFSGDTILCVTHFAEINEPS